MTLDGGWALIFTTILGIVFTGLGSMIWRHVSAAQTDADSAREHSEHLKSDLLSYKAHVAENYVKVHTAERMETKIFTLLERLENKVDKLHERHGG